MTLLIRGNKSAYAPLDMKMLAVAGEEPHLIAFYGFQDQN